MAGPYSGKSTLAAVLRVSAVGVGLIYGSMKLGYLQRLKAEAQKEAAKHH